MIMGVYIYGNEFIIITEPKIIRLNLDKKVDNSVNHEITIIKRRDNQ